MVRRKMNGPELLIGLLWAIVVPAIGSGLLWLVRYSGIWVDEDPDAGERARLIGADKFVNELALVQERRRALAARVLQVRAHRGRVRSALDDFRGTQAEPDFQARLSRVEAALADMERAYGRLCGIEARLWMRRASWGLVRRVQEDLSKRGEVSASALQALRLEAQRLVEASVDPEIRERMVKGSAACTVLDEAQERLRNHLAALRLRQLDASVATDAAIDATTEPLDGFVSEAGSLAEFESEMRELEAQTEGVLEVERMLA